MSDRCKHKTTYVDAKMRHSSQTYACFREEGHEGPHVIQLPLEPDYWTRFRAETAARMVAAYRTILQQEVRPDNAETAARWSVLDTDALIAKLRKGEE